MYAVLALWLFACGATPATRATPATAAAPTPEVPLVWVPKEDVPIGETLTAAHLEQRPVAWLTPILLPPSLQALIGSTPREPLDAGVPVRMEHLSTDSDATGLNAILPRGMQALTVPITTVAGLEPKVFGNR